MKYPRIARESQRSNRTSVEDSESVRPGGHTAGRFGVGRSTLAENRGTRETGEETG